MADETETTLPKRQKGVYVGAPACFALELACKQINDAFDGRCYLVGSALQRPDWRDIDIRFMMADDDFAALFPDCHNLEGTWEFDTRWLLMTTTISAWLSKETGLPVDFQFQPLGWANKRHDGPRNPIGSTYVSPRVRELKF